jgi:hypothetical protein
MATSAKKDSSEVVGAGCAGLLIVGVLIAGVEMCSGPSKTPEQVKADAAKAEADQRKGFHCLSGWDGSNRSLVDQIKQQLRDPDSFQHDETRITPEKDGKHTVFMRYRAKNGFGGMNVETAVAEVDHNTCDATIISTGDE